ncbi:small conductance mechanosensitive channel [Anoxybacillus mongoliensis]|uniref:Small conductance mechanosensitive channel n=2 Tax=Anoxybacillus TaxID=150247 RepID=A0A7W9YQ30_9BACL|nr:MULTISPECIES: mechanosensitive ion channel family protein [Anoxybacillus]MBB5355551.1 small conductance mechanosensitive channel [Anoxybacillus mongoliensis]MBB6176258.1 small conductance mechanosensitive channel [Anoxybacillus tengchongensis]
MEQIKKIYVRIVEQMVEGDWLVTIGVSLFKIVTIILLASILLKVVKLAITKFFAVRQKAPIRLSERREATLMRLLNNMATYTIYFITFMMILDAVGVDIRAILAGAGIVGLAVGFGAQNLVRDIITGFFIILEDQFAVGDYVRIGTFEGHVEEIGLRTTKLKSFTGEVHILPNGTITQVTNFSLNNSVAVVDVSIAYEGDLEKAEAVIREVLEEMPSKYEDIVSPPELLGVQNLGPSEVVMRITCETKPMRHWHIARALRKEIKLRLDERGIEIPFPRLVLYNREQQGERA